MYFFSFLSSLICFTLTRNYEYQLALFFCSTYAKSFKFNGCVHKNTIQFKFIANLHQPIVLVGGVPSDQLCGGSTVYYAHNSVLSAACCFITLVSRTNTLVNHLVDLYSFYLFVCCTCWDIWWEGASAYLVHRLEVRCYLQPHGATQLQGQVILQQRIGASRCCLLVPPCRCSLDSPVCPVALKFPEKYHHIMVIDRILTIYFQSSDFNSSKAINCFFATFSTNPFRFRSIDFFLQSFHLRVIPVTLYDLLKINFNT